MSFRDQFETLNQIPIPEDPTLWLQTHQVIAALSTDGDPIPTGWAPLDNQLRGGGIPPGRVITIGGPPFAGKTTIVCDIALHMAQKVPVFTLFADEGRSQASIRMGVMCGVPVETAERGDPAAATAILEAMGERAVYHLKPDTVHSTAEAVINKAKSMVEPGDPALIVLDSIQTIRADGLTDDNKRVAVERFMGLLRTWTESNRFIILATSRSNRASYRSKKSDENSYAIASFADSASIEYQSDVALVLGMPNDDSGIIPVEIVKNRLLDTRKTQKRTFQVRYDSAAGRMLEIDEATAEAIELDQQNQELRTLGGKILELVPASGTTCSELQDELGIRKQSVLAGLRWLKNERKVFKERDKHRILYKKEFDA